MTIPAIKVVRIRYCQGCEKMLPHRCDSCRKHPERKPRIVELFGVPPILGMNECGCVKIRCQRPGCHKTKWVHPRADGTLGHKNHFCSPECVRIVTAEARRAKRFTAPCSCGCGRMVSRPVSNVRSRQVFFSPKCHYLWRSKTKHEARVLAARALEDWSLQALSCGSSRCRGQVTDHRRTPSGLMACVRCNARRDDAIDRSLLAR